MKPNYKTKIKETLEQNPNVELAFKDMATILYNKDPQSWADNFAHWPDENKNSGRYIRQIDACLSSSTKADDYYKDLRDYVEEDGKFLKVIRYKNKYSFVLVTDDAIEIQEKKKIESNGDILSHVMEDTQRMLPADEHGDEDLFMRAVHLAYKRRVKGRLQNILDKRLLSTGND